VKRLAGALACLALAATAGCGQDEPTSTASPEAQRSGTRVTMEGIAFRPKEIAAQVGKAVVWTNEEDIEHNVVATGGAEFESEIFGKDGSYSFTPTEPGRVEYTCTLHPGMDGVLNVTR
jgi:plastocyanin